MRVPKENLLGKLNEGFKDVLAVLAAARIGMAALAVGIAQGALDEALDLREATPAVRQADPRIRSDSVDARGHGDRERSRPAAGVARGEPQGCGPAVSAHGVSGEALFVRGRGAVDVESDSDSRRIRLSEGLACRTVLSRRQALRDRRGYVGGAADGHCAGVVPVKRIVIANCGGFWGDDPTAPRRQVEGGPINYLVMDYLAEVTMAILQKQRARNPETGYPADVLAHVRDVLPSCVERGIRIITNAGGVNPLGCRAAIEALARDLGVADRVRVGVVVGDDMFGNLDALVASGEALANMDTGQPLSDIRSRVLSANAYIGAAGIVRALEQGANVVITGRVADAAVTLAPMMFEFGWASDDWDRLAAGIVAGHIIECGAQCTGGNFTDWHAREELPPDRLSAGRSRRRRNLRRDEAPETPADS